MTVIDTSGWLEYLSDGPLAAQYEKYLAKPESIITPSITLSEVYKKVKKAKGAEVALSVVAQMEKTRVIALDEEIALIAGDLALAHSLALPQAIAYATALREQAQYLTSNPHLKGLEQITFLQEKPKDLPLLSYQQEE
ncbi:type II toxin-antitoxin system VapC family toxin [Candidatus Aerophobetes bacterium]|nr:type II toxin-antitoxin system VapC family toxin [Candidatus Aerophobetes bacterium]